MIKCPRISYWCQNTQHNHQIATFTTAALMFHKLFCCDAESLVVLSIIILMLSFVMMSIVIQCAFMLSVHILSSFMLSAVTQGVIILSIAVPIISMKSHLYFSVYIWHNGGRFRTPDLEIISLMF